MSDILDALVYSDITNNMTNEQRLDNGLGDLTSNSVSMTTGDYLDSILDNTTIKRACSMHRGKVGVNQDNFIVNVRIPTPKDHKYDPDDPSVELQKKFGYIDKPVNVPASMCDTLDGDYSYGSQDSDRFMDLYCNNIKTMYKDEVAALGEKPSD